MSSLSYIARHESQNSSQMRSRALTGPENEALKAWWQRHADRHQTETAESVLRQCKAGNLWLACACQSSTERPLLHVFKRSDKLYLRRMPDRPAHALTCIYYRDQPDFDQSINLTVGKRELEVAAKRPANPPSFYVLEAHIATPLEPINDESRSGDQISRPRESSLPTLAKQLRWLLSEAGANVFPQDLNVVNRLLRVCGDIPVGVFDMKRYAFFSPKAYSALYVAQAAERAVADGLQDYAYLICPVVSRDLENEQLEIRYKDAVASIGMAIKSTYFGQVGEVQLPMLAIFKINRAGIAIEAYCHPMYDERYFCLVDSNEEREALRNLLHASVRLKERRVSAKVIKPMYAIGDTGVTPDFLVELTCGQRRIDVAIEVLGYEREEYRVKKQLQAKELSRLYRYVSYDTRVPIGQRETLWSMISGIAEDLW
jgi:hypothetical protein